jgi:hypothetical protein
VLRTLFSGFVGGMPLNAVAFVPPYRPYAPGAVALDKPPPEPGSGGASWREISKTSAHRSKFTSVIPLTSTSPSDCVAYVWAWGNHAARFAGLVALFRLFEISPRMTMALDQVNETTRLTIGEGVETTLAARQLGLGPAWPWGV